jgi:hypothetical protein
MHKITLTDGKEEDTRYLFEIAKVAPTPADLPRPWGRILKKPL